MTPADDTRPPAASRCEAGAPAAAAATRPRRLWRWVEAVAVAGALAAVLAFTHWTVSLYDGFGDWGDSDYYNLLVRGWRKGQLHLDKAPPPELLALADPYDPEQNAPYRLGDASLYEGKYYVYFGPAPAFTLMLPYALLTGRELGMGGATFWFSVVAFLAASAIWLEVRRRLFPASGVGVAALGVLALGFGTHLLALVQRPMIWELPIAAGVAFTLLGVRAALQALWGRRPILAMAVAGLCLGLAVGSRPTCLFALGVLVPPVWLAWRRTGSGPGWRALALAALIPLAACGAALMAHNAVRFGNPFEWGQTYQLSGTYERKWTHFSLRFLPHNLAVYLFQRPQWTTEFPFVQAVGIPVDDLPGYFGTEEVAGLAVTFPFFWLLLTLPLAWWRRSGEERAQITASLAVPLAAEFPVMALIMGYFSTTTRYQTDFAPALALGALAGLLALERRAQAVGRGITALVRAAAAGWVLLSVLMGVLLSFDYHGRLLEAAGPAHWRRLDRAAQDVIATAAAWCGDGGGPQVYKVRFRARPAGTVERFWESADANLAERVHLEHLDEHLIRFGFSRGDAAVAWGRPLRWTPGHTHTVSVQVPSLYPETRDTVWTTLLPKREFRRRTCATVWFSGGRALEVALEPPARVGKPGGAIGAGFTGEIRGEGTRRLRHDEAEFAAPRAPEDPGGVLRLEVFLPPRLRTRGEPLVALGTHDRATLVAVRPREGGVVIAVEAPPQLRLESPVLATGGGRHLVEVLLPGFRPGAFGEAVSGEVVVRCDGREILRGIHAAAAFTPESLRLGENPFGTVCEGEFSGWITSARWVR